MNICNNGVYSHRSEVHEGVMIQVHLKMPREVIGDDVTEWCFTGASRMSNVRTANDQLGVGVPVLYYESAPSLALAVAR